MAFILNKDASAVSLLGYNPLSTRVISINLKRLPVNLAIIQPHSPTAAAPADETKCSQVQKLIDTAWKQDVVLISVLNCT